MTQIKLKISGARATADVTGVLTSGMVGVQVNVEYDAVWEGLTKTLVCKSGAGTRAVVDIDDCTVVPAGVVKYSPSGQNALFVGVEGRNAEGELVIPSEMAFCGVILPGAEPTEDPSLSDDEPAWATIMSMIGDLEMLETEQRQNVVVALNELWENGGTPGPKGDKGDIGAQGPQGIQGEKGEKGDTGATGAKGADGTSVTVVSVSESDADGGSNVITFSDGKTITIKNGSKGSVGDQGEKGDKGDPGAQGIQGDKGDKGDTGATGAQGAKGEKGDTGAQGEKGDTGEQGIQGVKGEKGDTGATGAKGADGYTPVRGTDYWTDSDKAEIKAYVDEAILGGVW